MRIIFFRQQQIGTETQLPLEMHRISVKGGSANARSLMNESTKIHKRNDLPDLEIGSETTIRSVAILSSPKCSFFHLLPFARVQRVACRILPFSTILTLKSAIKPLEAHLEALLEVKL